MTDTTPCPNCQKVHYRITGYDRKCVECGHKWSVTPPALEVEIEVSIKAEVKIDVVTYFNGLPASAQESYKTIEFDDPEIANLDYSEEWERPMAFLFPQDVGGPISVLPSYGTGIMREWVEEDDSSISVRARSGEHEYGRASEWTEADFETLRAGVPWLDAWHHEQGNHGAVDPADLARTPGPLDDPLLTEDLTSP